MRIVAEEQSIEAIAVSQKAESDRQAQAEAALEHSQLRQERALRVARLKVFKIKSPQPPPHLGCRVYVCG
jgi:hypothetical protein